MSEDAKGVETGPPCRQRGSGQAFSQGSWMWCLIQQEKVQEGCEETTLQTGHNLAANSIPKTAKAFKGKMCATLGAGIAGYGSEFHKHTRQEMHRLRAATAEALGLFRSGANAWLAANATGFFGIHSCSF